MGAVFRGRHVYMRKDVALKVLRPDLSASADLVERFRREAQIAASLDHPHIVQVTDFGRTPEGWLFLTMELLFGESLFERLRREGSLPPEEAVTILWQVCDGLEAAHARGVVHRDLKPENVFLARNPSGREVAKLLDFGIAKMAEPSEVGATQAGMVVGTPEYLSPEQATGSEVDGRADLYTVGLMAWRALTGRHPFKADDPRSLLMMQATRPVPPMTEVRPDLADGAGPGGAGGEGLREGPGRPLPDRRRAEGRRWRPCSARPSACRGPPRCRASPGPTCRRCRGHELGAATGAGRAAPAVPVPGDDPFLPPRTGKSVEVSFETTGLPGAAPTVAATAATPAAVPDASPGWLHGRRRLALLALAGAVAVLVLLRLALRARRSRRPRPRPPRRRPPRPRPPPPRRWSRPRPRRPSRPRPRRRPTTSRWPGPTSPPAGPARRARCSRRWRSRRPATPSSSGCSAGPSTTRARSTRPSRPGAARWRWRRSTRSRSASSPPTWRGRSRWPTGPRGCWSRPAVAPPRRWPARPPPAPRRSSCGRWRRPGRSARPPGSTCWAATSRCSATPTARCGAPPPAAWAT